MVKLLSEKEPVPFWITSNDNPFNPFLEFEKWYKFDEEKGYKTCERIAKLAHVDYELFTEHENEIEIGRAILFLINLFEPVDLYRMVFADEGRVVGVPAHIQDVIAQSETDTALTKD